MFAFLKKFSFLKKLSVLKNFSLSSFWGWCGGRHFVLAAWFSYTAFWLAQHALLTKEYATVIVAIQGFVTWRTTHEDKKEVALKNGNGNHDSSNSPADDTESATGNDGPKG
jgi:hypothetical protein